MTAEEPGMIMTVHLLNVIISQTSALGGKVNSTSGREY